MSTSADPKFAKNAVYSRRNDIHVRFGGQEQSGISTPADVPAIFLFTGEGGESFGYRDGPDERGVFLYTGEGQVGDMTFVRGNKAVRDHAKDGKALLLFEALGKGEGVRFLGEYSCASYELGRRPDKNNADRQAIVFHLIPADEVSLEEPDDGSNSSPGQTASIEELRARAYEALVANVGGAGREARRVQYNRSAAVRLYVLARSKGSCESCLRPAPFRRKDGSPYLEPHHTERLSDNGLDHPAHVAAVCPTCHREIHYGQAGNERNLELVGRLKELESNR